MNAIQTQYKGIGGWLILIAIGLIALPFRFGGFIATNALPAFRGDTLGALAMPSSENYHPLWEPLLIFELFGNVIFLIFDLVLLVLFFSRKRVFPRLMIIFYLSNLAFVAADYFLAQRIPFVANQIRPDSLTALLGPAVGCLIWVPYFLVSKRVKATFTEKLWLF